MQNSTTIPTQKFFLAPTCWIIGRGGLLGSHLESTIKQQMQGTQVWVPPNAPFHWDRPQNLKSQFNSAVAQFLSAGNAQKPWTIAWAAGAGVIGSSKEALRQETENFSLFLASLETLLKRSETPGTFFFASSAGAVFAGSLNMPANESTNVQPISEYGRQKLNQEELLTQFSAKYPQLKILIGRISNLYGPGQNLEKPQGLISQLCRALILKQPINIYVPLDTVRDYLYVEDCATAILRTLQQMQNGDVPPGLCKNILLKIYASEEPQSINQVLNHFKNPELRRLVELTPSPHLTPLHPRILSFRSTILRDSTPKTSLAVGISLLFAEQERRFKLQPPKAA